MQPSIEIPEIYNFAAVVDEYAEDGSRIAIVAVTEDRKEEYVPYWRLKDLSNRFANVLTAQGIGRGDRVIVTLPRSVDAYVVYLGLLKVGAVVMPGSEMLRAKDLAYRIRHAGAKAVVAFEGIRNEFEAIRDQCPTVERYLLFGQAPGWVDLRAEMVKADRNFEPVPTRSDELAFLSYTSGTTGGPKGVMHTHSWPAAHVQVAATYWFDVRPGEIAWATAGPGWAKWVWSPFVSILGKGGTAFVYRGRFDPKVYLDLLSEYPIGLFCATPTEYRLMAKVQGLENYRPRALRSAVSAGEPLNREVIDTFQRHFGVLVRDGYGQTENSLMVGTTVDTPVRPGSMGRPFPAYRIAVVDEDGREVPPGQVGDIAIHRDAATLFKGYLDDPERTEKAFRGEWYITGDQAKMDEDGYFWFEGRADDIIISAGYTIGPFEVEDALVKHPAVAECAAVASPDPERGHIVKAFVVLREGYTGSPELTAELQEHVKNTTAPYKYPREIEYVDGLPKTTSGKIRRVELRAQERERKLSE
ncbi:acyl-CoA synthetase [Kyrpidia spormannii]|uniref:Acyl-coenzyme A synthetase n=2 Tax=Kyrpidia spormannii TaxID=2055160 RepID=A0ACA8Z8B9_9BACL|nr:acyl--CoA ligase [Kyrpidia spormannii]CAB3392004.1 putative acyl-coenzyme A synthetase [Kyrpidia spormannii]CAB3392921.1 putative acyl-coenzyme A synthetase [Kyrpidia spormannii]